MPDYPSVVIERELNAPVERVFSAWTDPAKMRFWFHASSATHVHSADVDLREGGKYKVVVKDDDGDYTVFGTYTQITPPTLLEFTWQWEESSIEQGETLVRVDLEALGERTKLRLTHSRFSSERSSQAHDAGWTGVLSTLASFVEEETP